MGRRRKIDKHLPPRVYQRRGKFYFDSPVSGRWEPLGADLGTAMAEYARKIGGQWASRTMGDVLDRYVAEVLPLKRSQHTQRDQRGQLARLKAVFGRVAPGSITTQHCYQYADARRASPSAAAHEIKLLGHVFRKAIRWGVATVNPVRHMETERKERQLRYVTEADFAAVYALASERLRIAMDLALLTGLRRGDLLALRWDQVQDGRVEVRTSKTGAGLSIEVTPALAAVLERARSLAPQVPRTHVLRRRNGRPYTAAGFSSIWQRTMRKAVGKGASAFTFHDLRRKTASDSPSVTAAQELLGHADAATTRRHYVARPAKVRPLR